MREPPVLRGWRAVSTEAATGTAVGTAVETATGRSPTTSPSRRRRSPRANRFPSDTQRMARTSRRRCHSRGVPENAETLALVCDDPDAPGGTFVHWLLWNVPGETDGLDEDVPPDEEVSGLDGARQGMNDFGNIGYDGPAPPEGDGPHTYRFTVYAVEMTLELAAGAERGALEDPLDGSTLGSGRLSGEYER